MLRVPPVRGSSASSERLSILELLPAEQSGKRWRKILIHSHNCEPWCVLHAAALQTHRGQMWMESIVCSRQCPGPATRWHTNKLSRQLTLLCLPLLPSSFSFLSLARSLGRHIPPYSLCAAGRESSRLLACNTIPAHQTSCRGRLLGRARTTTTPHSQSLGLFIILLQSNMGL